MFFSPLPLFPLLLMFSFYHIRSLNRSGGARILEQVGPAAGPKVVR